MFRRKLALPLIFVSLIQAPAHAGVATKLRHKIQETCGKLLMSLPRPNDELLQLYSAIFPVIPPERMREIYEMVSLAKRDVPSRFVLMSGDARAGLSLPSESHEMLRLYAEVRLLQQLQDARKNAAAALPDRQYQVQKLKRFETERVVVNPLSPFDVAKKMQIVRAKLASQIYVASFDSLERGLSKRFREAQVAPFAQEWARELIKKYDYSLPSEMIDAVFGIDVRRPLPPTLELPMSSVGEVRAYEGFPVYAANLRFQMTAIIEGGAEAMDQVTAAPSWAQLNRLLRSLELPAGTSIVEPFARVARLQTLVARDFPDLNYVGNAYQTLDGAMVLLPWIKAYANEKAKPPREIEAAIFKSIRERIQAGDQFTIVTIRGSSLEEALLKYADRNPGRLVVNGNDNFAPFTIFTVMR